MTLNDMDRKVLGLIEELNPDSEFLTDDPDLALKKRAVTNQVMFEMIRYKKIPKYVEMQVREGDIVTFEDIGNECGYEVSQIKKVSGVSYESRADDTVFVALENGKMKIELYVYPERITDKTSGSYEFELTPDVLEIMPYGIAADLLKSDASSGYGAGYSTRYESMKKMLDPRYSLGAIEFSGGVNI